MNGKKYREKFCNFYFGTPHYSGGIHNYYLSYEYSQFAGSIVVIIIIFLLLGLTLNRVNKTKIEFSVSKITAINIFQLVTSTEVET